MLGALSRFPDQQKLSKYSRKKATFVASPDMMKINILQHFQQLSSTNHASLLLLPIWPCGTQDN
jgi:hypothetical protein